MNTRSRGSFFEFDVDHDLLCSIQPYDRGQPSVEAAEIYISSHGRQIFCPQSPRLSVRRVMRLCWVSLGPSFRCCDSLRWCVCQILEQHAPKYGNYGNLWSTLPRFIFIESHCQLQRQILPGLTYCLQTHYSSSVMWHCQMVRQDRLTEKVIYCSLVSAFRS